MSEPVPEWKRSLREFKEQLRSVWDEISKLTDWSMRNETRIKDLEDRLTTQEDLHIRLRREFDQSDAKQIRPRLTWHHRDPTKHSNL